MSVSYVVNKMGLENVVSVALLFMKYLTSV